MRLITLITEDKVTDLFGIADDFHHFFDCIQTKYILNANKKIYCLTDYDSITHQALNYIQTNADL